MTTDKIIIGQKINLIKDDILKNLYNTISQIKQTCLKLAELQKAK